MPPYDKSTPLDEASKEIVREFSWALDYLLNRFPALRSPVIGLLSGSNGKEGFRLVGALDGPVNSFSWQLQPIDSGYECQTHDGDRTYRILHGSNIDIRESRDRGITLGAEHTFKSLLLLAEHGRMQGGPIYVEERLLSRLQTIELIDGRISPCSYRFSDLLRWFEPHRGKFVGSSSRKSFLIDEVLEDVEFLSSIGQTSVCAWWWDHLDSMTMEPRNDSAIIAYFKEMYRRIVLGYREVCETSLSGHLQNLGMYRALPMRWMVEVERGADWHPLRKPFRTQATWRPVHDWDEIECDVEIVDKIDFNRPDRKLTEELASLGRYAGRHLHISSGNFNFRFEQSLSNSLFVSNSVVLAEISKWMANDVRDLFRELGRPS
jgi:hypothetical protein